MLNYLIYTREQQIMDDELLKEIEEYLRTGRVESDSASHRWEEAVRLLRRAMPDGREGLLLLPPDPADPFEGEGGGWAMAGGAYSYDPDTRQHILTVPSPYEPPQLSDEDSASGMLQPVMVDDFGMEDFDAMDSMFKAAFDAMMRLKGSAGNDTERFVYHLYTLVNEARHRGMTRERLLYHVGHVYDQQALGEGDE
jgi:hypothetical protein